MANKVCHQHFSESDHAEKEHSHRRFFEIGQCDDPPYVVKNRDEALRVDRQRLNYLEQTGRAGNEVIPRNEGL